MSPKTAKANVTPIRQRTQFTCMSTSMTMALQALGHDCNEDTVNKVMGAQPMRGASWENALACAQHFGMRATLTSPSTVRQLKAWTDAGTPVLIAWNPEGREWSHASLVFDVDDDGNVWVADPNIPDPDETVRIVPKAEFYSKWYEKWPDYLVRRPAMAIEREITVDGRQVLAGKKELRSMKDRDMSRFIKNGPVRHTDKSDATHAMDKAQWEIRKDMGMAGLPGAGMGAGYHKDKSQYDRKREKNFDREANAPQPLMTRRDYGVTAMLNTTNFQRILKMAEGLPGPVEDYVKEVQDANPDYSEGQAWATAWSIYCKYKNPGSEHCQKSPSEYFRAAALKAAGMSKKAGYTHYWEIKAVPTPVEWTALMSEVKKILAAAKMEGIVVRGGMGTGAPQVKADGIWLNGDSKTGMDYETFNLEPVVSGNFCKTNQKPYDAVVVSILAAAQQILGKKIAVRSDGGPSAIRRVFGGDLTARFERGVSMTVDEVAEVVGPEFKEMNEHPPASVVKVMEQMQGKTAGDTESLKKAIKASEKMLADLKSQKLPEAVEGPLREAIETNIKDYKAQMGKSAAKRTTHLENPKKPGFNLCGEKSYSDTMADGVRETTCFYCKQAWEKAHGGFITASTHLSLDMFADILKDSKFEKGESVPLSELPEELQDNVTDPPPAVKKLTEELKGKQAGGVLAMDMFAEALKEGKFEEGTPADPTENMSPEDAAEWHRQNEEHKDNFKAAAASIQVGDYVQWRNQRWMVDDVSGYPVKFVNLRQTIVKDPTRRYKDEAEFRRNVPVSDIQAHFPMKTAGKTAATGLYGFNKMTEGACGAGVNKLQKAAKRIASALYAKDESSPSFLDKHAVRGGSKTASMLLKAMESIGPMAQINKTAGRSGTGLYGFSEKTAKLGLAACNDLHHEAGVIAGDLFARKGADPMKVSSYLASHAKKAKCPYAALLGECAPDAPIVANKEAAKKPVKPDTDFVVEEDDGIWSVVGKPSKFVYSTHGSEAKAEKAKGEWLDAIPARKSKKATDFLASDEEVEASDEVLDIVSKC